MEIKLQQYGPVISEDRVGAAIFEQINKSLKDDQLIIIDFAGIKSMVTFVAKQVFGQLYVTLGADVFFRKIMMKNISPGLQAIIKLGIRDAISDQQLVSA